MISLLFILVVVLILTNIVSVQYFLKKLEKKNDLLLSMRARGMEPDPEFALAAKEVEAPPLDEDEIDSGGDPNLIDPRDMGEEDLENLSEKQGSV